MDLFDQPIKDNKTTYDNIRKTTTGQGDDYATGSLVDYPSKKFFDSITSFNKL